MAASRTTHVHRLPTQPIISSMPHTAKADVDAGAAANIDEAPEPHLHPSASFGDLPSQKRQRNALESLAKACESLNLPPDMAQPLLPGELGEPM